MNLGATCYFNAISQVVLSATAKEIPWAEIKEISSSMWRYFEGRGPVSLEALLSRVNLWVRQGSQNVLVNSAASGARVVGWNDPLNAYTGILDFLQKQGVPDLKSIFYLTKSITCKLLLSLDRGVVSKTSESFILLSP